MMLTLTATLRRKRGRIRKGRRELSMKLAK